MAKDNSEGAYSLGRKAWDEAQHPREPRGTSQGGEFASKGGSTFGTGASKTYSASALGGNLTVTGTIEGQDLHIVRSFRGQIQHKFLRADIHANTPDELRIAVHADLDWLRRNLGK
jgi:hypothetical protein